MTPRQTTAAAVVAAAIVAGVGYLSQPSPPVVNWAGSWTYVAPPDTNGPQHWLAWDAPTNGTRIQSSIDLSNWNDWAYVWTGNKLPYWATGRQRFFR